MASPVDTTVKLFRDDMVGISGVAALAGVAGRVNAILKLCLVDGSATRNVTSLVVSGGIATITTSTDANNVNMVGSVQLIANVTGGMTGATDLNGEQRIISATATTMTFATAVVDGTATTGSTITTKLAPAGWAQTYTGTNLAEFHIVDPTGSGFYLRVDDTGTTTCQVRGYEAMSDINTGTGAFPTVAESANACYWQKSLTANSTANKWDFFADSRFFIFSPLSSSGNTPTQIGQANYAFGDLVANRSIDVFATMIIGSVAAPSNAASSGSIANYILGSGIARFPRPSSGVGSSSALYLSPEVGLAANYSGADLFLGVFPPPDGRMRLAKVLVNEAAAFGGALTAPRASIPGWLHVPQSALYLATQRGDAVIPNDGPLTGRRLYCVGADNNFSSTIASAAGRALVDISGPWR